VNLKATKKMEHHFDWDIEDRDLDELRRSSSDMKGDIHDSDTKNRLNPSDSLNDAENNDSYPFPAAVHANSLSSSIRSPEDDTSYDNNFDTDDIFENSFEDEQAYQIDNNLAKHVPANNLGNGRRTGYVYDERMLRHELEDGGHPEQPQRLEAIDGAIKDAGLISRLTRLPCRFVTATEVSRCHSEDYAAWLSTLPEKNATEYERQSVYYNKETWACAQLAAGSVLSVVEAMLDGQVQNGFAAVRPPGHHAECNRAFGFCFLNNVAIAAKHVQELLIQKDPGGAYAKQRPRVAIVDWDVHHGNGTQNLFFSDPSVLYISLHRYDNGLFFPVGLDGSSRNHGTEGRNVNIAFSDAVMHDTDYLYAWQHVVLPVLYEFAPEFILVSAGFDACRGDPIGGYNLSPEVFAHFTHSLLALAKGRVLLVLEGGYALRALARCALACVGALLGDPLPILEDPLPTPSNAAIKACFKVVQVHRPFWGCFGPHRLDTSFDALKKQLAQTHCALDSEPSFTMQNQARLMQPSFDLPDSQIPPLGSVAVSWRSLMRHFWLNYLQTRFAMMPLMVTRLDPRSYYLFCLC
jgi:acetoin utilization deacetylase AcuC-like enzyme